MSKQGKRVQFYLFSLTRKITQRNKSFRFRRYRNEMKALTLKPHKVKANVNFKIAACFYLTAHFNFNV